MELTAVFLDRRGDLRSGWRLAIYIALAAAFGFTTLSLYSLAGHFWHIPMPGSLGGPIFQYVLLSTSILFAAFLMLRLMDKRPFAALGFALHGRVWIELGQGALQGFLMVSVVFLVEWGFGWVTVVRQALDIRQLLNDAAYYTILLSLAALFEETATRGYAFQALIQGAGKPAAIIITSLLFGLVHAANPHTSIFGVLNTALAGIWLAIAYLKTRSLWLPTSLHTVWNLTLGFVFGFPLSGVILPQTLMRSSGSGPVWLTGGDYGPEAGAVTSAVLLAGTFFTWISPRVRPSPRAAALWWPEAPAIVDPGGPS